MGEAKWRRDLPKLADYLKDHVTPVAGDRDDFAAISDLLARMLVQYARTPDDREEAAYARCLKLAMLATVEGCNHELEIGGLDAGTIAVIMARCMGLANGYALMSLDWKDDAPHRALSRHFSEAFTSGLKFAIDECLEKGWDSNG